MIFNNFKVRLKQGHRTMSYPDGPLPNLPERFAGRPEINQTRCSGCSDVPCIECCPTSALKMDGNRLLLDLGRCVFCRECQTHCPNQAIDFTDNHQLAGSSRRSLIIGGETTGISDSLPPAAAGLFKRSLSLRVVSAGGCGACEADTNVLNTLAWDLSRFGIHFAASPRHADGLLLCGPISRNMTSAVKDTYDAIPEPKVVIAVGTCAVSGGLFSSLPECHSGGDSLIHVDLYIPGCPPHPLTILDGLLRFLGRIPPG